MELAINQYGEAFLPPSDAVAWQVRRMNDTKHGGPLPTFGADGRPLTLPLGATMADFQAALRKLGAQPGRFRLDPLDQSGQPIKGATLAYLLFPSGDEPRNSNTGGGLRNAPPSVQGWAPTPTAAPWSSSAAPAMWSTGGAFPLPTPMTITGEQYLIGEALRAQTAQTAILAAQIGSLVSAAADLVRAADGASLTKRKPGVAAMPPAPQVIVQPVAPIYEAPPVDDRDDREEREIVVPAPAPVSAMPSWLTGAVEMMAPMIAPMIQAKIGELLGGGGFAAVAPDVAAAMPRNAAPVIEVEPEPEAPAAAPIDIMPAAWSHLGAVARYLGADGKRRLDAMLRTLSREDQIGLARELVALPLADAAERVIAWLSVRELRAARARATATQPTTSAAPTAAPTVAHVAPAGGERAMPAYGPAVLDTMRAAVASAMAAAGEAPATVDASRADDSNEPSIAAETVSGNGTAPGAAVVELYNALAAEDNAVGSFLRAHPSGAMLVQAATRLVDPEALNELDRAITSASAELPHGFAAAVGLPTIATAAATAPAPDPAVAAPAASTPTAPTPPAAPVKVNLAAAMARMNEVLPHLTPEERTIAQSIALKMPAAQRDSMLSTLIALPVPEAVVLVREVVAEYVKHGRPFDR